MTPEEAVRIVESKSRGRTRYEGQRDFLDEVLVKEIKRLRGIVANCYDHLDGCSYECPDDLFEKCSEVWLSLENEIRNKEDG